MAHARTTNRDASITSQCGMGRRTRYISLVPVIVGQARTNMVDPNHILADSIQNTTVNKAVFIAPCICEVLRCYVNANTFVTTAASGSVTVKFTKAVIAGTDVDLCSTITVGAPTGSVPTSETAIDGTLSTTGGALLLWDGQLVYAVVVVSNHAVTDRSEDLIVGIEWTPRDTQ